MTPVEVADRRSFLTGSHAYGTPAPESDVDLVVFVETEAKAKIVALLREETPTAREVEAGYGVAISIGSLNLILVDDPYAYDIWQEGTTQLIARAPVTREEAVRLFAKLREAPAKGSK